MSSSLHGHNARPRSRPLQALRRGVTGLLFAAALLAAGALPSSAQTGTLHLPALYQRWWPPRTGLSSAVAQSGFAALGDTCNWEAGVLAYGAVRMWQATGQEGYIVPVRAWFDGCRPGWTSVRHVNDGLAGLAGLALYDATGEEGYLDYAANVAAYFTTAAPRTARGVLTHEPGTVWVDTLIGVVPFLVDWSRARQDEAALELAAEQFLGHASLLQPADGLFRHAWDARSAGFMGPHPWGRGNGWAAIAGAELLAALPLSHPRRAEILAVVRAHVAALSAVQDASGRWRTVADRAETYLETSGSALVTAGLVRGLQCGWLSPQAEAVTFDALRGAWDEVTAAGVVTHVSEPTAPAPTYDIYNRLHADTLQLYGQGAMLLVAASTLSAICPPP